MADFALKVDKNGKASLEFQLQAPRLSSSGKTSLRFSTGGFQRIDGTDMKINMTITEPIKL